MTNKRTARVMEEEGGRRRTKKEGMRIWRVVMALGIMG